MTSLRILISNLINVFLAVVSFFLVARIIFRLLDANVATPFVSFVYEVSAFLMTPFRGIFNIQVVNGSTLDVPAIVAFIFYLLIGYFLISLIETIALEHHYHKEVHEV